MARLDFFTGEGAVNSPAHIRPANNGAFPLIDAHDVQVGSNPTDADDRLDATLEDIDAAISNINDEIGSGSSDTNATIKKRLAAAETNIGNKVNTSDVQTTIRAAASASDSKIPSEKAVRSAIDNATVSTTDTPASGSAAAFSAGGAYTELAKKVNTNDIQGTVNTSSNPPSSNAVKTYVDAAIDALSIGAGGNYYTKEEANQAFYTAIVISSASLSKTTFEQGDSSNAATLTWHTNTLAVSAKVSVGGGTATETITSGERKNNGTYSTTIDTSTVNSNGSKSIAVKLDIEDAFEGTASKTVNATICNNIILGGAIKATASNGASVLADENMTQKLLQSSKNIGSSSSQKSVTVAANKYLTIAIPTAYGTPNKFYVNGSDIALPKIATGVSLTNQFNKTVTYDIYQNNQAPTSSTLYTVYTA